MNFGGATYNPVIDRARLETALGKVYVLMSDGHWRTLKEIATECGISEAGASARLRDLRKPSFKEIFCNGGVSSRRVKDGLWEYQVLPAARAAVKQPLLFDTSKPAERC